MKQVIRCVDDELLTLDSFRTQEKYNFGDTFRCEITENVDKLWDIINEYANEGVTVVRTVTDSLMPDISGDQFLPCKFMKSTRIPSPSCLQLTRMLEE